MTFGSMWASFNVTEFLSFWAEHISWQSSSMLCRDGCPARIVLLISRCVAYPTTCELKGSLNLLQSLSRHSSGLSTVLFPQVPTQLFPNLRDMDTIVFYLFLYELLALSAIWADKWCQVHSSDNLCNNELHFEGNCHLLLQILPGLCKEFGGILSIELGVLRG